MSGPTPVEPLRDLLYELAESENLAETVRNSWNKIQAAIKRASEAQLNEAMTLAL